MKMKMKYMGALLAASLGLGAAQANAGLITEWDFIVTSEWVTGGVGAPTFSAGGGELITETDLLSWGAEGGDHTVTTASISNSRSALGIEGSPVEGSVETNGVIEDTVEVTHYNNSISASFAFLETATLVSTLTLTPLLPEPGDTLDTVSLTVPIKFKETPNTGKVEDCGFPNVSPIPCDDIFVLVATDLTFSFPLDGFTYTTTIVAPGLEVLDDLTCEAADALPGCFGLTTPESAITPIQFGFFITGVETPVPAPATLALFGLGLMGLGAVARRRRQA